MGTGKLMSLVATGALVVALGLVGCGGSQPASSSSAAASTSSSAAASASASSSAAASSSTAASASTSTPVSTASSAAAPTESAATQQSASSATYIGEDAAKAAALADAGVAEGDCTEMKVHLDTDDAVVHYDVEFKAAGMEYDYDIDPVTGAILKADSEIDD